MKSLELITLTNLLIRNLKDFSILTLNISCLCELIKQKNYSSLSKLVFHFSLYLKIFLF